MSNKEKVIKSLEDFNKNRICLPHLIPWDEIASAIALLKEQEAVEPTIDEYGNNRCGSCGHKLQSIADQDLFCCKCGKPVLWEGR